MVCFGWSNWIFHAYCLSHSESTSLLLRLLSLPPSPLASGGVEMCALSSDTVWSSADLLLNVERFKCSACESVSSCHQRGWWQVCSTLPKSLHTIVLSPASCLNIYSSHPLASSFATLHFKLPACLSPASFPFHHMQLPCPACPNPITGFLCEWKWDDPDSRRITGAWNFLI